jgi:hypothetical protein
MRNVPTLAAAALIVALTQGCYTQPPLGNTLQTGRVQGIYVEAYNGVFVERQLASDAAGKALCAYVTFQRPLPDGRTFITAQLPAGMAIDAGDLVQVRFANLGAFESDAVPERNQVVALVSKGNTQPTRNAGPAGRPFPEQKLSAVISDQP